MYRVSSGHQRSSCWRTNRLNVITIQNDSFVCQLVNIWSLNFRTMEAYVTPSKIIHQNKQNIRFRCSWGDEYVKIRQSNENKRIHGELHCRRKSFTAECRFWLICHAMSRYFLFMWLTVDSWLNDILTWRHIISENLGHFTESYMDF